MTSLEDVREHASPDEQGGLLSVAEALRSRRSVRAYLPDDVPNALIARVLDLAALSPSNSNCQPWRVHVVKGESKVRLSAGLLRASQRGERIEEPDLEYDYQPPADQWDHPYKSRRKHFGEGLYGGALGIAASDVEAREQWRSRNFFFFDAPVGLMLTVGKNPRASALVDAGIFLQSVMLAARAHGLDTCPQATFLNFYPVVRQQLSIPEDQVLVCGMSMGYIDSEHRINSNTTARLAVEEFVEFHP